jgi:hypothetical protein
MKVTNLYLKLLEKIKDKVFEQIEKLKIKPKERNYSIIKKDVNTLNKHMTNSNKKSEMEVINEKKIIKNENNENNKNIEDNNKIDEKKEVLNEKKDVEKNLTEKNGNIENKEEEVEKKRKRGTIFGSIFKKN